jgi:hypothetical protein
MSDEGARDRGGPDERAWREVVDRTARSGGDCCELVEHLRTSRTEFDEVDEVGGGTSRTRTALVVLIVVAVPVILYSDLVTPNGATNYAGMGAGLVLMAVATLAHL